MRKYFYFCYTHNNQFGCGRISSCRASFPVSVALRKIIREFGGVCTITFWSEISEEDYEELHELLEYNK